MRFIPEGAQQTHNMVFETPVFLCTQPAGDPLAITASPKLCKRIAAYSTSKTDYFCHEHAMRPWTTGRAVAALTTSPETLALWVHQHPSRAVELIQKLEREIAEFAESVRLQRISERKKKEMLEIGKRTPKNKR